MKNLTSGIELPPHSPLFCDQDLQATVAKILNPGPAEYEAGVLTPSQRSVCTIYDNSLSLSLASRLFLV
jgi:hypothetical protein